MNRTQIIELFQEGLSGGNVSDDVKTKYHPEIIAGYIEIAMEQIASMQISGRNPSHDMVFDALTKTYLCIVPKCDEKRNEFFVDMPDEYMNLPGNVGVRHIGPTGDPTCSYDPIAISDLGHLGGVEAASFDQYYYLEHQKAWFFNVYDNTKKVRIRLIPKFRVWTDEDEINIPNGQATVFFQTVMELVTSLKATPTDKYDDNRPDYP